MDLLQVLLPNIKDFYILLPSNEEVSISQYLKIDIDFGERIVFREGVREEVKYPVITYYIKLDSEGKEKLKTLFKDVNYSARSTIHTRKVRIQVGSLKYVFNADMIVRADMGLSWALNDIQNAIKDSLKL